MWVTHIPREQNKVSHVLANFDRSENRTIVWLRSGPANIPSLCRDELICSWVIYIFLLPKKKNPSRCIEWCMQPKFQSTQFACDNTKIAILQTYSFGLASPQFFSLWEEPKNLEITSTVKIRKIHDDSISSCNLLPQHGLFSWGTCQTKISYLFIKNEKKISQLVPLVPEVGFGWRDRGSRAAPTQPPKAFKPPSNA